MDEVIRTSLSAKSYLPFHQAALAPDEAWGASKTARCACGREYVLWARKCPSCGKSNQFRRLLKKRKRIERWIDTKVQHELVPKLTKVLFLLEAVNKYHGILSESLRNPFPVRRKKENLDKYLRRVAGFYPAMFKATSPKKMAFEIPSLARRASVEMVGCYWSQHRKIFAPIISWTESPVPRKNQEQQAEHIYIDLMKLCVPFTEALRTLQLGHSRMVAAYEPVKNMLERGDTNSRTKALWNKARSLVNPVGNLVCFQTALWQNPREKDELRRFDDTLSKFLEQCKWFQEQANKLVEKNNLLQNTYRLSMRRHLVVSLAERAQGANPEERYLMTKRMLSQKGISFFLWRWFFGE